jgi:hypothetical protein
LTTNICSGYDTLRVTIEVKVGYGADGRGHGIAYATAVTAKGPRLLRVPFRVRPAPFEDRAVGYAALTQVAKALRARGCRRVSFTLGDTELVDEIATQRHLPETLVLAYVRLRCALNALEAYVVKAGATEDLTQRARAEAALNLAA